VEHAEGVGAGVVHLEHGVQVSGLLQHAACPYTKIETDKNAAILET
jgi:hypothetical protein